MALGLYVEARAREPMKGAWHGNKWLTGIEWEHAAKVEPAEPRPNRPVPRAQESWIASMLETAAGAPPTEEEGRLDMDAAANAYDSDVETAERLDMVLREAGDALSEREIYDRVMERWGSYGDVETAAQSAGMAYVDDYGMFRLARRPELRISEFDGHLWMADDGRLCVYRRTRAGGTLLPLSGTGLFTMDEFYRLKAVTHSISRPTPEIDECMRRHEGGRATKGEVAGCLFKAAKSLVAARLARWGSEPPPVLDPGAWRHEDDANREILIRFPSASTRNGS